MFSYLVCSGVQTALVGMGWELHRLVQRYGVNVASQVGRLAHLQQGDVLGELRRHWELA